MGFFNKIKEGLKKTRDAVIGQIDSMLKSFTKIDDELFEELEELLVMGDVGVPTAEKICEELKKRVKKEGIKNPNEIHRFLRQRQDTQMLLSAIRRADFTIKNTLWTSLQKSTEL